MSAINFVLEAFTTSVQLDICGNLYSEAFPTLDVSATSIIFVDRAWMKSIFKYRTDAEDVIDASLTDIKYFTFSNEWDQLANDVNDATNSLNPANAQMHISGSLGLSYNLGNEISTTNAQAVTYPDNKRMVCHDFTRYLALKLFNTAYGVDLFNNEAQLLQNIRTICGYSNVDGALKQISNKLYAVDTSNASISLDPVSQYRCTTNGDVGINNICRVLMSQMIKADPNRFSNINADQGAFDIRSLPFQEGDTIEYKLTIYPADNQHQLTGVPPIEARSYRVIMYMTDDLDQNANVEVATEELP